MKKCSECGKKMEEKEDVTPERIAYKYFKCPSCGEEIVDMQQLHDVAKKYRALKRYHAKVTKGLPQNKVVFYTDCNWMWDTQKGKCCFELIPK